MSSELLGVFADEDDNVFVDEAKLCGRGFISTADVEGTFKSEISSLDRVRSLKTPQTIRSLIRLSEGARLT